MIGFRCPFCHEGVRPAAEPASACAACLAPHHAECWDEHGGCSSCGASEPCRRSLPWVTIVLAAVLAIDLGARALEAWAGRRSKPPARARR